MTIKQWFIHLLSWLRMFPRFKEEEHLQISHAGDKEWWCPVCGAEGTDKEFVDIDKTKYAGKVK